MAKVFIGIIRLYQIGVSPIFGANCRFSPTCSQYAIEAIGKHGALWGAWYAVRRILRCQPFNKGGYDPVP